MAHLLLAIIYLAFISLGLPDALLGAAWPAMYQGLGAQLSWAGIVSMIISLGTILSSLLSGRLSRRLGAGTVTALSVAMTAAALFGFSRAGSFLQLCLWAVPYGLGAGSVDAVLNNYVALHYQSRHMSWLHCFWGVGATAGPYVMGLCLTRGMGWTAGYGSIGLLQAVLTAGLFLSLPLWRGKESEAAQQEQPLGVGRALALPGAKAALVAFLCYCALESSAGLWASSFLAIHRGLSPELAASRASLFYLGITLGRLLSGFITDRFGDTGMIRGGMVVIGLGLSLLLLPLGAGVAMAGLLLVGLGCAPIYPSLIHQTPENFGRAQSQSMMGMQMAFAYVGSSLVPPLFGILAQQVGIGFFAPFLLLFLGGMCVMVERMTALRASRDLVAQDGPTKDVT